MDDFFLLILGVIFAGVGGEIFLRGTVGLGRGLRIAPIIIGVTVAAFATSSPELVVAISAALAGKPQISLGDILGSNIVNISLILGLALCFSGIRVPESSLRRDFPIVLSISILIGGLLWDGRISRSEGFLLLLVFLIWLTANILEAYRQRKSSEAPSNAGRLGPAILLTLVGLGLLLSAGRMIVIGANGVALAFGLSEFIIGATLVALGTSIPELATVLVAKFRGQDDIGIGTILGSNIFNSLFIIAIAAIITPIEVLRQQVLTAIGFGLTTVMILYPGRSGWIGRWRGILLLIGYVAYLALIVTENG